MAIVGAGPIGLALLLTAQFDSLSAIFMIDLDDERLAAAKQLCATNLINSADGHAAHHLMELTEGAGVDVAIEAVGLSATFALAGHCRGWRTHRDPSASMANRWSCIWKNSGIVIFRSPHDWRMRATAPMLLKVVRSGKLVTHRFVMNDEGAC